MAYTTTDLVTAVRRLAYLPDASDITDVEILARADEEMATIIADAVKAGREGFWLTSEDTPLVPSQTAYAIPRRALGRGVVGVGMVNSDGTFFTIPQIDPVTGWNGRTVTINSYCYSFQADKIVFPTAPPSGYSLRVLYLRRPSQLVPISDAGQIGRAVDAVTIQTFTKPAFTQIDILDPTRFVGLYADIVRGDAPFDLSYVDLIVTGVTGSSSPFVVALSATTPVDPTAIADYTVIQNDRVDYLCARDQTVYPAVPVELQPVLEAATAVRIAESIRDSEAAAMAQQTLAARRRAAVDILEPRNEEGSRPIVRSRSPLRQTFGIGRRWR